jgi:rhodanese-related sulfurtransferase
MRNYKYMKLWMLIIPFLFMMSCKDDADPAPVNPIENASFDIMTDYMVAEGLDLPDVLASWITARPATADEVGGFLSNRYVMDIRSAADFDAGHISGAVNSSLAAIVADAANAGDKQILVVCYTGQTASHATVALRLSGFTNAQVLKWGMSGWTGVDGYDKWTPNTSSQAVGAPNWTMDATAPLETFEYPSFTSTSDDGATILAERVEFMVTNGFQGVASADVLATPANYHINNYWAQDDVDHYGHIAEAYRISPLTLAGGEFKNYNPAATAVTYCWTGQTSSMITAYLTVLGYDAKSLKFGANSMIHNELESHKWAPIVGDYPVVTD